MRTRVGSLQVAATELKTSSQSRSDVGGSFASRRGHSNQLSISDPSHHVTEAIGTLYGDDDDSGSESGRPLSFIGGSYQDQIQRTVPDHGHEASEFRYPLVRSRSDQPPGSVPFNGAPLGLKKSQTLPVGTPTQRSPHMEPGPLSPLSPSRSLREVQADQQFPLTNIDNPSDIAQELSNLQALRRLSMDVGNSIDPDMPPMSLSTMPTIAPSGDDDENDPSRLLWVPARVHPELAPTEFRSFLEKRVQSIRRRSGESFLSVDGDLGRNGSSSSLRRKKSTLSRQIDNTGGRGAEDYVDGAEKLGRQRSLGSTHRKELSIEELVQDPTKAVQKLTQDSAPSAAGETNADDMPILPMAPGMGLRRSTRTTYRKGGSVRSGDKAPFSRRIAQRQQDQDAPDLPPMPSSIDAPPGHTLSRVQSEPIAENYSRPTRSVRRQHHFAHESPAALAALEGTPGPEAERTHDRNQNHDESLSTRRVGTSPSGYGVPTVGVVAPEEERDRQDPPTTHLPHNAALSQPHVSQKDPRSEQAFEEPPPRSSLRPSPAHNHQQAPQSHNSRHAPSAHDTPTSSFPGGQSTRTDALTYIPILNHDDRKPDKKKKDKDDDAASVSSSKSSTWKWFKSGTDEKEKKKEESKRLKAKNNADKAQDNVRLDVIQTSIDKTASKGRESLVLDRDNVDTKLHEERKKESNRKSDSKKEKDGSIFSSIFGGSKKKDEKERSSRKAQHLQVPEEPPYKPMVPDVDYAWTRFPLLEERAIYRMAHIKLANPRRPLHSQVLLSNFMYSYLAIVQAMHPQMNVPTSPQQKRLEEEARRKQQEEEYQQQQALNDQDAGQDLEQYDFDYHRATMQYGDSSSNGQVDYVDEAQIYEDEHGNEQHNGYGYDSSEGYGQGAKEYYYHHDTRNDRRHEGRDDGW
ncbi:hypothetical protein S7711_07451 [Stachybotrys chartarum IBT 7711]|uniref:Protein Zds1 C-terminal domain-containing protein n=1 Tax=Stachybotrys chartarum (strain CBS 109288 / IBT 7711) TaxID=1280523 RepID=A0A084AFM3_STACB|nr:hypothetical protein S7711_07451 [Stachybotrys chartarum IBT 7711]